MKLELGFPDPSGSTELGEVIEGRKIGVQAKKAVQSKRFEDAKEKKWQGKLMTVRWEDKKNPPVLLQRILRVLFFAFIITLTAGIDNRGQLFGFDFMVDKDLV